MGRFHQLAVVKSKTKVYGTFSFEIRNGAVQPHRRQNLQYEPHVDYLPGKVNSLPWRRGEAKGTLHSVYWLRKLNNPEEPHFYLARLEATAGGHGQTAARLLRAQFMGYPN